MINLFLVNYFQLITKNITKQLEHLIIKFTNIILLKQLKNLKMMQIRILKYHGQYNRYKNLLVDLKINS